MISGMRQLLAAALVLSANTGLHAAESLTGYGTAYDGDRIDIRGERVRLFGIDAPEHAQTCADASEKLYPCGRKAEAALQEKIAGKRITCAAAPSDDSFPTHAVCRLGDEDLGAWLVEQGLAVADRSRPGGYVTQEDAARGAKRGMWTGIFTRPADWRAGARGKPDGYAKPVAATGQTESAAAGKAEAGREGCAIKGNITREGTKRYWVPGSRRYAETVITESTGERWFCTEAEAQAAGWSEPQKETPR